MTGKIKFQTMLPSLVWAESRLLESLTTHPCNGASAIRHAIANILYLIFPIVSVASQSKH